MFRKKYKKQNIYYTQPFQRQRIRIFDKSFKNLQIDAGGSKTENAEFKNWFSRRKKNLGINCQNFKVREAGTPHAEKNQNLFGHNGLFMGSRIAQEITFGLFSFSRNMILKWGGPGGARSTWSQCQLREILLVPDLWAVYGLFRYATDDHPQTAPEKLSILQKIRIINF